MKVWIMYDCDNGYPVGVYSTEEKILQALVWNKFRNALKKFSFAELEMDAHPRKTDDFDASDYDGAIDNQTST